MKNEIDDSDFEFWADFEQNPKPKIDKKISFSAQIKQALNEKFNLNADEVTKKHSKNSLTTATTKEFYDDKINRIREAKEPEIQRIEIITRNKTSKLYETQLKDMKEQYQANIKSLTNEFLQLKRLLVSKDQLINFLVQLVSELEINSSQERTLNKNSNKHPKNSNESAHDIEDLEKIALFEETINLRSQIEYHKELASILQSETDKANAKAKTIESELQNQKFQNQTDISLLKEQLIQKDQESAYQNTLKLFE